MTATSGANVTPERNCLIQVSAEPWPMQGVRTVAAAMALLC
jgi:hypothetical protein